MEIRNLHTFLQVAAMQSFTKAAHCLGYSQSNISAQIQQLENTVGAPLFNRIGRHISLTQYGEELLPYARQIVSTAVHMENFLKSSAALGGTLRIGMVESLFELLLAPVLHTYHQQFPRVTIDLTVDATAALKEQLQLGMLDLACLIDDKLPADKWRCWYSQPAPISIVANPSCPLTKQKSLTLTDLDRQSFILMEESAPYSQHFQSIMAANDINPHVFLKLQSSNMAVRLLESENCLAVLPDYTVTHALSQGTITRLTIAGFHLVQQVQLVLHHNKVITPQINGLLQELKLQLCCLP